MPGLDALGAFHLLRPLGAGGMARVWLAVDARSGRQVAIKRMLDSILGDAELRAAFIQEAELGLRLHHPNIVETLELGEVTTASGVEPYLVLELLQGRSLIDVLRAAGRRRIPVPLGFAVRAIVDAARALDHAHTIHNPDGGTLGLVHRDVSPHNLFACADGHVKLLDFGIAKTSTQLHNTRTGLIKGKLAYLSPEQIRGQAPDARVDVFGLGIVLHELLVGRPLFRGDNEAETLHRVLALDVPAPDELRPDVPAALSAIALRALQRDRDRRLPSAGALADAVEAVADASGIHAGSGDVSTFIRELFPEDAREQAADQALVRRTYEYLSSSSLRAIVTDAWATPPKELERSPRGPRILRDALLLVGALALTGVVAVFTMHLLRGQAAPAMATQPPPIPPAMNERSARPSPPERFVAGGELRGPPGPLQAPARSPELGATTRRDGAERAHGAHHVAQGSLRVAAHPWAQVSIDGRAVGTTPLSSMTITEGKHSIVFTNSELGISAQRRVIVRAGQESVLVVDLFAEKSKRR